LTVVALSDKPQAVKLMRIVLQHFCFKMFGTMGFTLVFFIAYLFLLRHPLFPVRIVPVTWLDRAIAFEPAALPVYLSLWCYVSLPPVLMLTRGEIVRYGWRIGLLSVAGLAIFLFWPNAVPPADIDWARYPQVGFLKHVDTAGNACPSLHVATAVFSCIWLFWRLRRLGLGVLIQCGNLLWCLAIVYSTMAIKQHMAIDVLAGIILACGCAGLTGLREHACRVGH